MIKKWNQFIREFVENSNSVVDAKMQEIKELVDRYETPMPLQLNELKSLEEKVNAHLSKMGFIWN